MEVIPAIDLLDGCAVRLRKGNYDEVTVYSEDPPALARTWASKIERIHVVDLEGARAGRAVQADLVRTVVTAFGGKTQVGGGIRSIEAVESYAELGVDRIVLGTAALRDPDLVEQAARAHPDTVVVAVDARNGFVATEGWLDTSETPAVEVVRRYAHLPLAAILYTDIDRDGTEVGPNLEATERLARDGGLPVIASGGVGTLEHLRGLAATREPIVGAIVGRAIHEGRFTIDEAVRAAASVR